MNFSMYLVYIPIFAVVVGYMLYARRRTASMVENSRPAAIRFFERTGYCFHDRPNMPAEAQADRSALEMNAWTELAQKQARGENYEHTTQYVRNHHGLPVHFVTRYAYEKTMMTSTSYQSAAWTADLPAPPRVPIHIADKALTGGVEKAAGDILTSTTRRFTPHASKRISTGIESIDAKFAVWGEDETAVREVFAKNPALAAMLADWASLDVYVTGAGAVFNDPGQKNMMAAMGGMVGGMSLGFDMNKRMELSIPVHDRVADLLLALVRATA